MTSPSSPAVPSVDELARRAARLEERGAAALAAIPLSRRLEIWDDAVGALLDPTSEERRALVPSLLASSRLSPEGLSEALHVVLEGVRGDPARAIAGPAAEKGRDRGFAGVVLAGNVPALAAQSLLPALLAGVPLLMKSASDEPHFAPALVAALAAREPSLADAFDAVVFPGADVACLDAAFGDARRVLAYGGGEAIAALRARFGARLVARGPKASVAVLGAGVAPLDAARQLARDVALFDQRGCLSPQAVYTAGDPVELAQAVAWALELEERRLPPGPPLAETLAVVQQVRADAALRALAAPALPIGAGTVIVETTPRFRLSPGHRTLRIHSVAEVAEAVDALAEWEGKLQGVALGGDDAWRIAPRFAALGVTRVVGPGELQLADAGWANGGVDPLALFE